MCRFCEFKYNFIFAFLTKMCKLIKTFIEGWGVNFKRNRNHWYVLRF